MAEPLKRLQHENLSISGCRIVGTKQQNAPALPCGWLFHALYVERTDVSVVGWGGLNFRRGVGHFEKATQNPTQTVHDTRDSERQRFGKSSRMSEETYNGNSCRSLPIVKVGRAGLQPNADFPQELPVDARQGTNREQLATELEQLRLLLNHLAGKSEP